MPGFMKFAVRDQVRVLYSKNGAKGNVYMESFNFRFKEENRLLYWEQKDFASLNKVFDQLIRYYNRVRRHSALGNQSPVQYFTNKGKIPSCDVSGN
jgi:putative transposase